MPHLAAFRRRLSPGLLTAALISSAALAFLPVTVAAQQACGALMPAQSWPSPLNRRIALRARDVSLREAIDRIAAAARFRVSYSAEFLPLDRRVCVSADSIVAGDALAEMLAGVNVSSIVTGADQVVIAPSRPADRPPRESVQTLERVVVTGSAMGTSQRPLSVAIDVLDGRKLDQQSAGTLSASFDGNVAGLWLWEQAPSSLLARYGSIRGASSFGVSYPKVYIDGIEVANPLLITELNPAVLDRVEVIRGPQGAALYGADAISGVVNIITRHDGLQSGAARTEFVSRAGLSQTAFVDRSVLAQNHSLTLRAGSNVRSGSLGLNVTTLGGYVPEAHSRDVKLNGAFRVVTSGAAVTGTARYFDKSAAVGQNPLIADVLQATAVKRARANLSLLGVLEDSLAELAARDSLPQSVRQYTVGMTSTLLSGTTWVPSFSAGIDGYRLSHVPNDLGIIPSAIDSALHSAEGGADRMTFRTSLVGQYQLAPRHSLTLTVAGEHSYLQEIVRVGTPDPSAQFGATVRYRDSASFRSNTGLVAQGNLGLNEALYLTAGARLERNNGSAFGDGDAVLPMAGLAYVREIGRALLKVRGAYGVGIRPSRSATREFTFNDIRRFGPAETLDPERQSGTEVGADFFFAKRFTVQLTRFDQKATGLIQPVAVPRDSGGAANSKRLAYVLQNVGEISNRGWELESSVAVGVLNLRGAFTTVDSRVEKIARKYVGDMRIGDRMLAVPAGTASMSATLNVYGWRAGLTASRAFDWINYDRLRLTEDYAIRDSITAQDLTGVKLRSYWMRYDGVTRLRASVSRELPRGFGLRLTVDNLTNAQKGEPDNITVLPGRTVLLGLSAKLR